MAGRGDQAGADELAGLVRTAKGGSVNKLSAQLNLKRWQTGNVIKTLNHFMMSVSVAKEGNQWSRTILRLHSL